LNIHYTPGAIAQLEEILSYISDADPAAASRVAQRIENLIALLAKRPGIGRPIANSNVHIVSVRKYPYAIFYRMNARLDCVEIIRIRHTRRRPLHGQTVR
jgi:plasmid stabilization system protein ParE